MTRIYLKVFLIINISPYIFSCSLKKKDRENLLRRSETTSKKVSMQTYSKSDAVASTRDEQNGFFVADLNRPPLDPNTLHVYRAVVAKTIINQKVTPKIVYSFDGLADFVHWQVCHLESSDACSEGKSVLSELLLGFAKKGNYEIQLRACVQEDRSIVSNKYCGPITILNWQQDEKQGHESDYLDKIRKLHGETQNLSQDFRNVLTQFKHELAVCKKRRLSADQLDKVSELLDQEIAIQVENVLNLGAELPQSYLPAIRDDEESDGVLAEVFDDELDAVWLDDSAYNPEGLLLTDRQTIKDSLEKKLEGFYRPYLKYRINKGTIIPPIDIAAAAKGSSGLFRSENGVLSLVSTPSEEQKKKFKQLDSRRKSAIFAGLLAQNQQGLALNEERGRQEYVLIEMIRSLFFIKKPFPEHPCQAYDHVESNLNAIKKRVREVKKDIDSLFGSEDL